MSVVGLPPGQPFSDINVAADRDNILALYYNEGFPNATLYLHGRTRRAPSEEAAGKKGARGAPSRRVIPSNRVATRLNARSR